MTKVSKKVLSSSTVKSFSLGVIFALLLVFLLSQLGIKVFAGRAGLPGNNKNPEFYTTCTGADPSNPDQTPPTISMTTPTDGTYVQRKSLISFKIESSDNVSLNRNELYVNGVIKGIVYSSIAPYSHGWEVPPNANSGTVYQVYSRTCDVAGNFSDTPIIQLIVK